MKKKEMEKEEEKKEEKEEKDKEENVEIHLALFYQVFGFILGKKWICQDCVYRFGIRLFLSLRRHVRDRVGL